MKDKAFIEKHGGCTDEELLSRYAYRLPDHVKSLIKGDVSNDPLALQYIPQAAELNVLPEENEDPIGDEAHSPVKGIVHRYPDRVLFKPVHVCPVYCRYCFRREMVGPKAKGPAEVLSAEDMEDALSYIAQHKEIYEVILTGGDPLVMGAAKIKSILTAISEIEHVRVVRIHSRVPLADPKRITRELCECFAAFNDKFHGALYVAVHVNHAREISSEARAAFKVLQQSGAVLLSQSVLLRGVNDSVEALEDLFRELVALGVKPYYFHHPDMAPGTSHFRVSIEEGQALMRALQGRVSGLCLPTYMLDIPGGHGKIPLTPCYIEQGEENRYKLTDYKGGEHEYG